jgi:hypothetical protein
MMKVYFTYLEPLAGAFDPAGAFLFLELAE